MRVDKKFGKNPSREFFLLIAVKSPERSEVRVQRDRDEAEEVNRKQFIFYRRIYKIKYMLFRMSP